MRIVLEEDQDSRAVAIAEPGNNHVKFALEERDRHGWYETAACWHEVAHLKSAIALAGQYTAFVQRIASMAGAPDAGQACRNIIAECKRQQREGLV